MNPMEISLCQRRFVFTVHSVSEVISFQQSLLKPLTRSLPYGNITIHSLKQSEEVWMNNTSLPFHTIFYLKFTQAQVNYESKRENHFFLALWKITSFQHSCIDSAKICDIISVKMRQGLCRTCVSGIEAMCSGSIPAIVCTHLKI